MPLPLPAAAQRLILGISYHILYSSRATATSRRSKVIQLLAIPATVALIIGIVGGVDRTSSNTSDQRQGTSLVKAGLIIFLVVYVCILVLAAKSATQFSAVPVGEKRVLAVVLLALPLLAVRILWSLLAYFGHMSNFSILNNGAVAVLVRSFMSTLEESLVVIAYTVVGLMVGPAYGSQYDVESTTVPALHQVQEANGSQRAPEPANYTLR